MNEQLDLRKTYRAILEAARAKQFISYGDLAKANDSEWNRSNVIRHLGDLVKLGVERGWPMLSAIVVTKDNVQTGSLHGGARKGFIRTANWLGINVIDPDMFVKEQQDSVFAWALDAPEELEIYESEVDKESNSFEQKPDNLFDDLNRQFWFVGASSRDGNDQTKRFLSEGIWQYDGDREMLIERVGRMRVGDRIAIKASYVRKKDLPFDNRGRSVSCMRIKAIGIVIGSTQDGKTVKVDWQPLKKLKEWYFYTYRFAVNEADTSQDYARRLIRFTFGYRDQDYEFWLRRPYWAKKYRPGTLPAPDDEDEDTGEGDDEVVETKPYGIDDILEDGCFLIEEEIGKAFSALRHKRNLILQGPPGTGKTWLAKRLGYALVGTKDRAVIQKRMRAIQFHPSLSYEDFVRGWRPGSNGTLSLVDGVFLDAVEAARAESDRPMVVIVEEINRGNPAQIFGEMLTLIETDKRTEDEAIALAYSRDMDERIYIPENLYLIGTMNIADRSLALVDLALRRRFAFVSLKTALNERWMEWCVEEAGMERALLIEIKRRMDTLNEEIAADRSLGPQFKIGHSYVTPMRGQRIADARTWFSDVVEKEIAPLLEEYWFDNPERADERRTNLLDSL